MTGVSIGRLFPPASNINDAYVDPILKRTWGGPLAHIAVVAGALVLVAYPLTHALLVRVCETRRRHRGVTLPRAESVPNDIKAS